MKQFLLTAILMACTAFTFAQSHIEKTGEDLTFTDDKQFQKMLGEYGPYFYSLRKNSIGKGYNYYVEQYNKTDLKKVKTIPIGNYLNDVTFLYNLRKDFDCKNLNRIHIHKNKMYIFYDHFLFNDSSLKFMVNVFDLSSGILEKENLIKQIPYNNHDLFKLDFTTCISPDSSMAGIIIKTFGEDDFEEVHYALYELNLNKLIIEKKLPNQFKEKLIRTTTFTINNQGDLMYLYWYKIKNEDAFVNGGGFAKYSLLTNKLVNFNLNSKKKNSLFNVNYLVDSKTNRIYLYSMMSEGEISGSNYLTTDAGFYIAILNQLNLEPIKEKIISFNPDIKKQLLCYGRKYLSITYTPSLSLMNDNVLFMILNGNEQAYGNISFAKEIIVSRIDSELNLAWTKMIPRLILCPSNNEKKCCTTAFFNDSNRLAFVFLEHVFFDKKNENYKTMTSCDMVELKTTDKSNCVMYGIDLNGNIIKETLFSNKKDFLIPSDINIKTGTNTYIVRFHTGKKESFGTLTLNH